MKKKLLFTTLVSCTALVLSGCSIEDIKSFFNEEKSEQKQEEQKQDEQKQEQQQGEQQHEQQQQPVIRKIEGVVKENESKSLLSGAAVAIRGSSYSATSDAEGKFTFTLSEEDSKLSSYTVDATLEGYKKTSKVVNASDFTNDAANVELLMISSKFDLTGSILDGENPVVGAKVDILDTEFSALSDAEGKYEFKDLDRFSNSFKVKVSKDGYKTKTVTVEDLTSNVVTQDISVEKNFVALSGKVTDINGDVAEATVEMISGSDVLFTTTTNATGAYAFENAYIKEGSSYQVRVSKTGYKAFVSEELNELSATVNAVLIRESANVGYTYYEPTSGFSSFTLYTGRDEENVYFDVEFDANNLFARGTGERNVSFWLNFNDYNELPAHYEGSKTIEFKMWLDNNNYYMGMWEYSHGGATEIPFATWNDTKTWMDVTGADTNAVSKIHAKISYERINATLGECTFSKTSPFAFMFTQWNNDTVAKLQGTAFTYETGHFDYCGHGGDPREYFWVDSSNVLSRSYKATHPGVLTSISVSGAKSNFIVGDTFESTGLVVEATDNYGDKKDVTTQAIVDYSQVDMSAVGTYTVTVSYQEGDITKTDTYEVTVAYPILNFSGKVEDVNGNVSGATVKVWFGVEVAATATTDENGAFSITNVDLSSSSYNVTVEKDGYTTAQLNNQSAATLVHNFELVRNAAQAAYIWNGDNANFSSWHSWFWRTSTQVCIDLEFTNPFIKGAGAREFSIWMNFDENPGAARLGTKTIEFRFDTENWSGLLNYKTNNAGDFVDYGQWGSQTSVWFEKNDSNQIIKAHYWLNIAYVNTLFGENTMNKASTFNWTMSQWNGDNTGAEFFGISDWSVTGGGSTFCDPANPSTYMGFNSYNQFVACVCNR